MLSACLLGVPLGAGYIWGSYADTEEGQALLTEEAINAWQDSLDQQQIELNELIEQERVNQVAVRTQLADMKSQLIGLGALGERLTEVAGIASEEFNFSSDVAAGGPVEGHDHHGTFNYTISQETSDFAHLLSERADQLQVLEHIILNEVQERESAVSGRPIVSGWLSSRYGYRTDPFSGKKAWHNGVDFAGREGADVVAVGAGVVTWAESRYGYGNLVEINHGNGLVTRYGHNKEIKVKPGDVVRKGQVIASMGSTGRSTGPHVHFEVYKHGRAVDPATYINRTYR